MTYYIDCIGEQLVSNQFLPGIIKADSAYAPNPRTIVLTLNEDISGIVMRNFKDNVPVYAQYLSADDDVVKVVNAPVIALKTIPVDALWYTYITVI
ncbi:MAG TPA: hypothetical protein PKV52_04680 [Candidatus Saccharibacteria bacterium]|nr:hypothetical protein [Candidatus Saccharibacteria bacterium]